MLTETEYDGHRKEKWMEDHQDGLGVAITLYLRYS